MDDVWNWSLHEEYMPASSVEDRFPFSRWRRDEVSPRGGHNPGFKSWTTLYYSFYSTLTVRGRKRLLELAELLVYFGRRGGSGRPVAQGAESSGNSDENANSTRRQPVGSRLPLEAFSLPIVATKIMLVGRGGGVVWRRCLQKEYIPMTPVENEFPLFS